MARALANHTGKCSAGSRPFDYSFHMFSTRCLDFTKLMIIFALPKQAELGPGAGAVRYAQQDGRGLRTAEGNINKQKNE